MERLHRATYMVTIGEILFACAIVLGVLSWPGSFEIHRDLPEAVVSGILLLAAVLGLADVLRSARLPAFWRLPLTLAVPVLLVVAGIAFSPHEPRMYVDLLVACMVLRSAIVRIAEDYTPDAA